ncbi:uncharacterized protein LOC123027249 isoform X2 [Varanus komodoensis]|uniref:uncharacterized protein LOC123027249 isoform X2 n=1 Tax=Varanus komodoensis TaxID=61221 RepID=UPI001CF76A49|nr:uncharacterized protein LOC123027249 isoform X2 [Varanus komodoensis]
MVQGRGSPWVRRRCRTAPPSIHSGCFFLKCLRCPGNMAWMMLCDAHGLPGALCRAARRHVQSRHRSGGAHGSSLARNATAVHKLHDGWKDVAGKPSQESSLGFSELAGRLRLDRLAYSLEHSSKSRGGDMQVIKNEPRCVGQPHSQSSSQGADLAFVPNPRAARVGNGTAVSAVVFEAPER